MICTRIANLPLSYNSKAHRYKVEDFMPQKKKAEVKKRTPQEMFAYMRLMNAAFGGKEVTNG
jgi:hypothetical protein